MGDGPGLRLETNHQLHDLAPQDISKPGKSESPVRDSRVTCSSVPCSLKRFDDTSKGEKKDAAFSNLCSFVTSGAMWTAVPTPFVEVMLVITRLTFRPRPKVSRCPNSPKVLVRKGDEDVVSLDVTVYDPIGVQVLESLDGVDHQLCFDMVAWLWALPDEVQRPTGANSVTSITWFLMVHALSYLMLSWHQYVSRIGTLF